jgi:pantoate--beta-alanine ligase
MTEVAHTRAEIAAVRKDWWDQRASVAVVMTMGALHAGHTELIRRARDRSDKVVVTNFLNPLQFVPGEDLDKYPRTFAADLELCRAHGVDLMFAPDAAEVYLSGEPEVRVAAGRVGDELEGHSRPGHFDGVLTVVAKMLHLTAPDAAFFGQKDAQQLWIIRQMVIDLDFPVEIIEVPTVRDPDGLALSSRNTYLTDADREAALSLNRALRAGSDAASRGRDAVIAAARDTMSKDAVKVDYVELVSPDDFQPFTGSGEAVLLVAAFVGTTRLIDNVRLVVPAGSVLAEV